MQHPQLQIRKKTADCESGFVLLAVIFLTVILIVSLAIAAPKIARSIQRDKELETIHRGEQYKRAIKLYYQKFGSYPTSIDQLVETNQMRFLRKKYKDPLTGKDDWKPVLFGQAHVRPLGFFGQPLMTVGLAGTASMYAATASTTTDANGVPIASPDQSGTDGTSGSSGSSGSGSNSGFGSSGPSVGSSGSSFGSSGSSFGSSGSSSVRPVRVLARPPRALDRRQPADPRRSAPPRRPPRQDPRRHRPSDRAGRERPPQPLAGAARSSASRCRSISHR
jgi:type II secretory pathway pseudopilin PulG